MADTNGAPRPPIALKLTLPALCAEASDVLGSSLAAVVPAAHPWVAGHAPPFWSCPQWSTEDAPSCATYGHPPLPSLSALLRGGSWCPLPNSVPALTYSSHSLDAPGPCLEGSQEHGVGT